MLKDCGLNKKSVCLQRDYEKSRNRRYWCPTRLILMTLIGNGKVRHIGQ